MNPLTQIKNTQKATKAEIELGISDKSSWHARFKHSAYIYAGGLPFELTEGDVLAVFSQYGEIVDIHLVRDKQTGKSRGFAFLAYEDQRSTVLAVDNLSGTKVTGRIIRVEHVDNYRKKRAEVEGEPVPTSSADAYDNNDNRGDARGYQDGEGPTQELDQQHAPSSAPWQGGNSLFDIMAQARAEGIVGNRSWKEEGKKPDDKKSKKEKRQYKKEKKERKEKKDKRKRSLSPKNTSHVEDYKDHGVGDGF